jgi:ankyrin repeat protein
VYVAISCSSPELISLLLKRGADVSTVDTMLGLSPVEYAIRMDDREMLSLLMEKRPKIMEQLFKGMNDVCRKPNVSVFLTAAKYGHTVLL